ncbi:hypothetical protein K505DRAFT_134533 [Melanomma pulvis-pyrius CBS 109.77]|uniref:Uncharacterized protein n=1 Tax=Melanomma pulvis-pyrius CBS 109.77 TaxID=1314802 RepID=A0A6A6WSA8_9PLEO|nr:hypothetical protein K505DRAFT_134533 [Melanomma pulvis-pyrius CBS 109.77]
MLHARTTVDPPGLGTRRCRSSLGAGAVGEDVFSSPRPHVITDRCYISSHLILSYPILSYPTPRTEIPPIEPELMLLLLLPCMYVFRVVRPSVVGGLVDGEWGLGGGRNCTRTCVRCGAREGSAWDDYLLPSSPSSSATQAQAQWWMCEFWEMMCIMS